MNIHQLSVRYLEAQDRILVRVNTREGTEMRLWLTRRLTLALWPTLNRAVAEHAARQDDLAHMLHDEVSRKILADFQREAVLQEADFTTPYQDATLPTQTTTWPLGTEPLLVTEVRITPEAHGPLKIAFNEQLPEQENARGFQVELAPALVHGLVQLLERALHLSAWGQGHDLLGSAQAQANEMLDPTDRPKYLN
jgi:hypothetical protein